MHVYGRKQNVGHRNLFCFRRRLNGDVGFVILKRSLSEVIGYFPDDLLRRRLDSVFGAMKRHRWDSFLRSKYTSMGRRDGADANKVLLYSFEFAIRRHEFVNRDVCKNFFVKPAYFFPRLLDLIKWWHRRTEMLWNNGVA
jgi:hypothetical protein